MTPDVLPLHGLYRTRAIPNAVITAWHNVSLGITISGWGRWLSCVSVFPAWAVVRERAYVL